MELSYLRWLFIFAFLPLLILWIFNLKILFKYKSVFILILIPTFIFSYLWDKIAIYEKIWYFKPPFILGISFLGLPLEEYLFISLEALLFCTLTILFWEKINK